MDVVEAWSAIRAGRDIPANNPLLREPESEILRAVAAGNVLEALLLLGGRQQVAGAQKLIGVRNKLAEAVRQIDALFGEEGSPQSAGS
jgi:hypothetical protein